MAGFSFFPSPNPNSSASTHPSSLSGSSSPSPFASSSSSSLFSSPNPFGFGASSTPRSLSLFGTPAASSASPNPFGFGASSTPRSSSLFGTPAASSASAPSVGFGASSTPTSSSLFCTPAASSASAPSFGFGASSTPTSSSLFGTPAAFSTPACSSLFGTPAASSTPASSSSFGAPAASSSPFGASSVFGSSSGSVFSSNLFGSSSSGVASTTSSISSTIFGSSSSNSVSSPAVTVASSLFPTVTTTTASTPAVSTLATSTVTSGIAFPSFGASSTTTASSTAVSSAAPTVSFPSFATPSTASSSGTTGLSFSLSTKTPTTASASQPQPAALFGPASTSTAEATSSISSAAQSTSDLDVVSCSGTTSTVSAAVASAQKLPSEIAGKTVEEIIKEWNAELQGRTGKFRKQVIAIAKWDRRILQNCDVLIRLETEVTNVVEMQTNLERQLELIETHQEEVGKGLQSMEDEAERTSKDERGLLLDDEAASTRDAMYEQAEFIERELEQMTEQIKSIIQAVNANQVDDDEDDIPLVAKSRTLQAKSCTVTLPVSRPVDHPTTIVDEVEESATLKPTNLTLPIREPTSPHDDCVRLNVDDSLSDVGMEPIVGIAEAPFHSTTYSGGLNAHADVLKVHGSPRVEMEGLASWRGFQVSPSSRESLERLSTRFPQMLDQFQLQTSHFQTFILDLLAGLGDEMHDMLVSEVQETDLDRLKCTIADLSSVGIDVTIFRDRLDVVASARRATDLSSAIAMRCHEHAMYTGELLRVESAAKDLRIELEKTESAAKDLRAILKENEQARDVAIADLEVLDTYSVQLDPCLSLDQGLL